MTIRRPDVRNALNGQAFRELAEICGQVGADRGARALLLTGQGKAFSAGGDFEALQELLDGDRRLAVDELSNANRAITALVELEVPTVAALNGDAFGGGAAVALAADFRIMAADARLGFVFARLGLSGADTGATWWLSRLLGPVKAFEILSLGRVYTAEEACAAGLVTQVATPSEFETSVEEFLTRLAGLAPLAVSGTKRALAGIEARSMAEQFDLEAEIQADVIGSADFREGLAAFRERRAAKFEGA
ncbi:MAG: Short-chain-enoyl-CoA hydratase [Acidimicrobiales bacterium]|nr:Short-chain-enoyl-CoA hydratase [Acidimicrobiales bacterium]